MSKNFFAVKFNSSEYASKRSKSQIIASCVLTGVVVLCCIMAAKLAINGYVSFFGKSIFRVVTGSMEPTINIGELIICEETDFYSIEKNDIICYKTKISDIRGSIVTHRVVDAGLTREGVYCLQTKGDANLSADPYFVGVDDFVGKVVFQSGNDGIFTLLASFIFGKFGFLACIVIPILAISIIVFKRTVRNMQKTINNMQNTLKAENKRNEHVSGYSYISNKDYDEIKAEVLSELLKELNNTNATENGTREETEYEGITSDSLKNVDEEESNKEVIAGSDDGRGISE